MVKRIRSLNSFLPARIVIQVPPHEFLQTTLQIRGRLVPKLTLSIANVGMSKLHIPIPRQLHYVPLRLNLQKPLQNAHEITNRNRRSVPQIEHPQLCWPPLLPTTPRALLCSIQSPQTTPHNIINVSKIPINPIMAR